MSNAIRIGFVGVGQIAQHHLNQYSKIDGAEVVAACDVNEDALRATAEKFGIPNITTHFRELLNRDDLDAIDVCLHNNMHSPVTIAALQAGKHVYCEKPMAGAYVDAKAMIDAAKETGKNLSIQLATLFGPHTKVAKKLIDEGHLGKVYHGRSTGHRRRGRPYVDGYGTPSFVRKQTASGGALYDMGVYHISQMLFLLGSPKVERISGKIYQETEMDENRRNLSNYDVEELGLGFVKFEGGVTMDVIESWAIHMGGFEASSVAGSRGGIRMDPLTFHSNLVDVPMNATFEVDSADWRWHVLNPIEEAYDSPQHHWIRALQGVVPLLPTDQIALDTMLVSEGIYLSDKLGREVTPEEVLEHSVSTALQL